MTLEQSVINPDTIVVRVDANEVTCDGGKPLPYATWIGTISRATGRIDVWTPAAYRPRGYRSAARRMLEGVARDLSGWHGPIQHTTYNG